MSSSETVTVRTRTTGSTQAHARHHDFVIDKLPGNGGNDDGPMASEYLLAALGSCQVTTAHKIALKRRQPIDSIVITATAEFEADLITGITLDIEVHGGPTDEDLHTIFRLAERSCTVSRALSVPVQQRVRRGA